MFHRRRCLPSTLLWITTIGLCAAVPSGSRAGDEVSPARVLLRDAAAASSLEPAQRFALAWQLADHRAMRAALEDEDFARHLREWAAARLARREHRPTESLLYFGRAARHWPTDSERERLELRRIFDRQRVEAAVDFGDSSLAHDFLDSLLSDADDPVLRAYRAWTIQRATDPVACAEGFERAWTRASALDREHPVFLRRAQAHLAAGDTLAAAESWSEVVSVLSRPQARRRALEVWDAEVALARTVVRLEDGAPVRRWLSRSVRRPEALALARRAFSTTEGVARAELFEEIASHLYLLRESEKLESWLSQPWPADLDDEGRAELRALPLQQERRRSTSRELAQGFETVAREFPETRRGLVALWEAAWMYELDGALDDAIRVQEEFVDRGPSRPRADDAALRSLVLHFRRGDDYASLRDAYRRVEPALGDGIPAASALWLLTEAARIRGGSAAVDSLRQTLSQRFPDSPLLDLSLDLSKSRSGPQEQSRDAVARRLFRIQREAFQTVGEYLRFEEEDADRRVAAAARLLELGLVSEAEAWLLDLARTETSNTLLLYDICRAAWRWGSPEVQARVGFLLRRRLSDDGEELQTPLLAMTRPTPFFDAVWSTAAEYSLDPEILWAVMRRESFYDPDVVSVAGAHGLVQLMPYTARDIAEAEGWELAGTDTLFQPVVNLRFGAQHLRDHLQTGEGNPFFALAAYNAGPRMAETWRSRLAEGEPEPLYALIISYHETRTYVYDVLRNQRIYRQTYPVLAPDPSR